MVDMFVNLHKTSIKTLYYYLVSAPKIIDTPYIVFFVVVINMVYRLRDR